MAKYVRSLDPNLQVTTLEERNEEETVKEPSPRVLQRAAKLASGPVVTREKKQPLPANVFAGMTPRQIKQIKRRPEKLAALLEESEPAQQ